MARSRMEMRTRQAQLGMAMQAVGAHAVREYQAKIAVGTALNLSIGEIAQLMAEGSRMERAARGEDIEVGRYTQIIINVGDAVDEPDANTLSDDTTGESIS